MTQEHEIDIHPGKQPITDLIEIKLYKIVSTICPATTRQIQQDYNESMTSIVDRLKAMRQKGIITGTKKRGHWIWNLPEVNNDSN